MALKPHRSARPLQGSDFFSDAAMAEGGVLTIKTAGKGSAMDDGSAVAEYAANPSGKIVLGILTTKVVDIDETKQPLNRFDEVANKGGKVNYVTHGVVTTNMIHPDATPVAGPAYLIASGLVGTADEYVNDAATPKVGEFVSTKDADGYVKLRVSLPN